MDAAARELQYVRHYTIKAVTQDAERFQFNTSISRMMELLNATGVYQSGKGTVQPGLLRETAEDLIRLMAPFAPHFCEEQWEKLGHQRSIFHESWPIFDPAALVRDEVEIVLQINGVIKYRLNIPTNSDKPAVEQLVMQDERTEAALDGRSITKFIYVPNRLVNLVVR